METHTEDIRKELVLSYRELLNKRLMLRGARREYVNGRIDALALAIALHDAHNKGDKQAMWTINNKLVLNEVDLATLGLKKDNSMLVNEIVMTANRLAAGKAALIDTSKVNGNSFVNTVYQLRKENKIPKAITVVRREANVYLAHKG